MPKSCKTKRSKHSKRSRKPQRSKRSKRTYKMQRSGSADTIHFSPDDIAMFDQIPGLWRDGLMAERTRDFQTAEHNYHEILKRIPYVPAYLRIGWLRMQEAKRYDDSLRYYNKALHEDRDNAEALLASSWLLFKKDTKSSIKEAIARLSYLIQREPKIYKAMLTFAKSRITNLSEIAPTIEMLNYAQSAYTDKKTRRAFDKIIRDLSNQIESDRQLAAMVVDATPVNIRARQAAAEQGYDEYDSDDPDNWIDAMAEEHLEQPPGEESGRHNAADLLNVDADGEDDAHAMAASNLGLLDKLRASNRHR